MSLTFNTVKSSSYNIKGSCPQGVFLGIFFFIVSYNGAFLHPSIDRPRERSENTKENEENEGRKVGSDEMERRKRNNEDKDSFTAKWVDDSSHLTVVDLVDSLEENSTAQIPLEYYNRTGHRLKPDNKMQRDIDKFMVFLKSRDMELNFDKSSVMRFCFSSKKDFYPTVLVDRQPLKVVTETRILGIIVTESLKWEAHVELICAKAMKKIGVITRLIELKLDYKFILDVYEKEIRSILEYGAIVYHSGLTQKLSNKIENIQKIYFRILSNYLGIDLSYSESVIFFQKDFLFSRRMDQCIAFVKRNLSDPDAPQLFVKRSKRETRPNNKTFHESISRTSRCFSSPLNFLTRLANDLMTN